MRKTLSLELTGVLIRNVNIISLSLGGGQDLFPLLGSSSRTIEDSVNDAMARGIFVVAAAGNDGGEEDDGDVASPGSERRVICVGGVTQSGSHWSKSSTGNNAVSFPTEATTRRSGQKARTCRTCKRCTRSKRSRHLVILEWNQCCNGFRHRCSCPSS